MADNRGSPDRESGLDSSEFHLPSCSIAFSQLQDLVRTQTTLAARLKYMLEKQEDNISREEYEDVKRNLEEEKYQHMQTQSKLFNLEKQMEFALAEVAMLSKELENERDQFKKTSKELKISEQMRNKENSALLEKCTEISEVCGVQDDILTVKDKKIRNLEEKLAKQNQTQRIAENENELRLQQERYLVGHNYANSEKFERNRGSERKRGKFK